MLFLATNVVLTAGTFDGQFPRRPSHGDAGIFALWRCGLPRGDTQILLAVGTCSSLPRKFCEIFLCRSERALVVRVAWLCGLWVRVFRQYEVAKKALILLGVSGVRSVE